MNLPWFQIINPLTGGIKIIAVNEGKHGYFSRTTLCDFVNTSLLSKD
jgi:hypothetical protein